jgi:hypothetical protein
MQLASSTFLLVAALLLPACDPDVRRTPTDIDGDGGSGVEASGAGGGSVPGDDDGGVPDEDLAMCPAPPARPDGLREGSVPSGVMDEPQASAVFQRASHEVGHIVSVLNAPPGDAPGDFLTIEGDSISADRDGEALRGTFVRDAATGKVCAAIRFGAWTGGHGGWGLSALDGTMYVLIEGTATRAQGSVGLVESGALEGAPVAEVHVEHDGELLSGDVGEFTF